MLRGDTICDGRSSDGVEDDTVREELNVSCEDPEAWRGEGPKSSEVTGRTKVRLASAEEGGVRKTSLEGVVDDDVEETRCRSSSPVVGGTDARRGGETRRMLWTLSGVDTNTLVLLRAGVRNGFVGEEDTDDILGRPSAASFKRV